MPPWPIAACSRSLACIPPVGCMLKSRTWLKIAAPMKSLCSFNLRANLQAISAADAARERIGFFLRFGSYARTFAEIVAAVDGNPGLDALQALEHELTIDGEIPHDGKFRHRFDADRLFKLVDQGRARHARFTVDQHRARTANFFQAVRIVRNRCRPFAIARNRVLCDVTQQMITFSEGLHGSANSSQRADSLGLAWRLMRRTIFFVSAMPTCFFNCAKATLVPVTFTSPQFYFLCRTALKMKLPLQESVFDSSIEFAGVGVGIANRKADLGTVKLISTTIRLLGAPSANCSAP